MSSHSVSLTLRDSWKKLSRVKVAAEDPALLPSDETLMTLVQKRMPAVLTVPEAE